MDLSRVVRWKKTSNKEIASLEKHGVFKLVPIVTIPTGRKVVSTRWVFEIMAECNYKSRLVFKNSRRSLARPPP